MKMVKRVVSIEAGVWWTKVALVDYRKKNPPVHKAFAFRTPEHAVEDGYIRDKEAFASALKAELSRHDIHEKEVVFTLSSSKVVTREVMIPFVKDNKIMGIIEAQIRDYFPMDVSNYTISYSKMDVEEEDGKKMLKLLLVAIPDNLLNNYVTFAELAGLKVETFDYIGNGTVQLLCDSFLENAVVVQLEEQATVISILENKKLVDHFFDSPPTGPPVGFLVFGADFEVELAHLQCRRESSVFAFPSVFPMISRQILRRVEVVGFSIGEAKVGETHKKSDLLIFGIEKRDSPLVGKYVVIYSLSSH